MSARIADAVPEILDRQDAWVSRGRCTAAKDPDLWFALTAGRQREAQRVCAICPVRLECLAAYMSEELDRPEAYRFGVFGALTPTDRRLADPSGPRLKRDRDLADETAPCGSYKRLLHHLVKREPVDVTCWVGEVARTLYGRPAADGLPSVVLGRPPADGDEQLPADGPEPAAPAEQLVVAGGVPDVIAGLVWQPGDAMTAPPAAPPRRTARPDPFAGPRTRETVPDCGTQEGYDRHLERDEPIDPQCWNAIGRQAKTKGPR